MAEAGMKTRSYNLGVDAMRPPEDSVLLETVLAKRKKPLGLVIVESYPIVATVDWAFAGGKGIPRQAYWHDAERMRTLIKCSEIFSGGRKLLHLGEISSSLTHHFHMALCRLVHFGRGFELLEFALGREETAKPVALGPRCDGYVPVSHAISDIEWRELQKNTADRLDHPGKLRRQDAESQRVLLEERRLIESHGGRMLLLGTPTSKRAPLAPNVLSLIPFLDLSNPAEYPRLYERENWADHGHLNAKGAELFTRMLVERLIASRAAKNPR